MSAISPVWAVRKGGVDYPLSASGSSITYRTNNPSEATLYLENDNGALNSTFSGEDEVTVKIGSTTMLTAIIRKNNFSRSPSAKKPLKLEVVDWGMYLAGKTPYEKNIMRATSAATAISNMISDAPVSGLTANITGLTGTTSKLKRDFYGSYLKDFLYSVGEISGADYFIDESKVLQIFPHGSTSRDLIESGSGTRYVLTDAAPVSSNQIKISLQHQIDYAEDSTFRFRDVTVTNGIYETYPLDVDSWQSAAAAYKDDYSGKTFSHFYSAFANTNQLEYWKISATTIKPIEFIPNEDLGGGLNAPVIKLNILDSSSPAETFIRGQVNDGTGLTVSNWLLKIPDWQNLGFFIKNGLTGASVNHIYLRLYDAPVGPNYWERDIYNDILLPSTSRTDWTYLQYDLPDDPSASTSNGWTKNGSPTEIDLAYLRFENGAAAITGYDPSSYVGFSKFHFYRRQRYTQTGSGPLPTRKLIIDASAKNSFSIQNLAVNEQARVNVVSQPLECTIPGNINFRKPGYNVDFTLTNLFGAGATKTRARLEEITHRLENGVHWTEITINDAFQRA